MSGFRALMLLFGSTIFVCSLVSCSLTDLVGQSEVPVGTSDPAVVATETGALDLYQGAMQAFAEAVGAYTMISGLLTDELRPQARSAGAAADAALDARMPTFDNTFVLEVYSDLQRARGFMREARGAIRAYAPLVSTDVIAHTYAVEGFAELLMADLFCSGIPLSTIEFGGDYTLRSGSTTIEVYHHALRMFDSAQMYIVDSVSTAHLVRIGQARAHLALAQYDSIEQILASIPVGYQYQLTEPNPSRSIWSGGRYALSVSDGEGVLDATGMKFVSLNDPRVKVEKLPNGDPASHRPYAIYRPLKYDTAGTTPIILASGIEARLMQAEVALRSDLSWLPIVNALRTICITASPCATPAPPGSGGIGGLPPLEDPGTMDTRLDVLIRERALWLFLTGHRQGDLRRLLRHDGWSMDQLYASGRYYVNPQISFYGTAIALDVPQVELDRNPLYTGCFNRDP